MVFLKNVTRNFKQSLLLIVLLQVLKTRLALAKTGQYRNMWHCLRGIAVNEGPRALYKGLTPSLAGIIPYAGIDLTVYEVCFRPFFPLLLLLLFLLLLLCQLFLFSFIRKLYLHFLHPSILLTITNFLPHSSTVTSALPIHYYHNVWSTFFQTLKNLWIHHQGSEGSSVLVPLACGTVSSTCGQLASYPLSLLRTRLQAQSKCIEACVTLKIALHTEVLFPYS